MNERRRPFRRGRGPRPSGPRASEPYGDADPYREPIESAQQDTESIDVPPRSDMNGDGPEDSPVAAPIDTPPPPAESGETMAPAPYNNNQPQQRRDYGGQQGGNRQQNDRGDNRRDGGRRNQRNQRGRG